MSFFLALPKKAILKLSKSLPAIGMAEDIDFEAWGHKFVVAMVSESIFVESNFFNEFSWREYYHLTSVSGEPAENKGVIMAIDEAHIIFDSFDKREWVGWAGKTLMPKLHGEIEVEKSAAATAEKRRANEEQREREKGEQQEKFDRRAEELIRAFQEKKIDQEKLQSSVQVLNADIAIFKGEAMAESVAMSPPATQEETTHDEAERGEVEVDEESIEPL
jgi:hypothetical protein